MSLFPFRPSRSSVLLIFACVIILNFTTEFSLYLYVCSHLNLTVYQSVCVVHLSICVCCICTSLISTCVLSLIRCARARAPNEGSKVCTAARFANTFLSRLILQNFFQYTYRNSWTHAQQRRKEKNVFAQNEG
jgi:hypothetical protein